MAELATLSVGIDSGSVDAAILSFSSVSAALEQIGADLPDLIVQFTTDLFDGCNDAGDLFRLEISLPTAGGALEALTLKVLPSERYLELIAALTRNSERVSAFLVHDWPVLSLVSGDTSVNGGAGESISRPKAAA